MHHYGLGNTCLPAMLLKITVSEINSGLPQEARHPRLGTLLDFEKHQTVLLRQLCGAPTLNWPPWNFGIHQLNFGPLCFEKFPQGLLFSLKLFYVIRAAIDPLCLELA